MENTMEFDKYDNYKYYLREKDKTLKQITI